MKREIYSFNSTLELENYVNELRLAHVRYLLCTEADLHQYTDEDLIAIYACRNFKEEAQKKKMLDKLKEV